MVDLLKAADALDRYRLPRNRWWPDLSRARVTVPEWLPALAFDMLLLNSATAETPAAEFVDRLAAAVAVFPYLGYLYFEVLSEYLMLHPDHDRLIDLVGQIEPGLAAGGAEYTRQRLGHLFAVLGLDRAQDLGRLSLRDMDFETLAATVPSLLGQAVFREMRLMGRYSQLYLCFEQAKALEAWDYWNAIGIATPFNGFLPKGEIGVNPAYPRCAYQVWVAETCERGLLHPTERLDVGFVPRLAELGMTAMRRDGTGKAAGHLRSAGTGLCG